MNKKLIFPMFVAVAACFLCIIISKRNSSKDIILNNGLKFCESVLASEDGLLIANFGGDALNPLNQEGKGYISRYYDGEITSYIAADGHLNAPKGMMLAGDKLFVADVNKVVVYNTDDLATAPYELKFPEGEMFVNHIIQVGDLALISVTNTGNIFTVDLDKQNTPVDSTLKVYTNIVGANGLLYHNSELYVASYPADGTTTETNQIYKISDLANPSPVAITKKAGHYDGLALHNNRLYFTDWQEKALGFVDLETNELAILEHETPIDGPAEIDIFCDYVVVPDLVNSKVYMLNISSEN